MLSTVVSVTVPNADDLDISSLDEVVTSISTTFGASKKPKVGVGIFDVFINGKGGTWEYSN